MARTVSECEYCGANLGGPVDKWDQMDVITCGARECERWARDCQQQMRDEAHDQLDRDLGYGYW